MEKVLNLKVPKELHEKVKKAAREKDISMGAVVRRALELYLKKGE